MILLQIKRKNYFIFQFQIINSKKKINQMYFLSSSLYKITSIKIKSIHFQKQKNENNQLYHFHIYLNNTNI